MKRNKLLMLAAATLSTFGITHVAIAAVAIPTGWYLEGNVGATKTYDASYGAGLTTNNSGVGWNVNGGYKFMPYFAGEIGFTHYTNTNIRFNGSNIARDSHYSYDIAAKAILPFSDSGFDAFAKLGAAHIRSHVVGTAIPPGVTVNVGTHSTTNLYYGLGGEYNFMPELAANIQWARAKGNNKTGMLDLWSIGLSYMFG